MSNEEGLNKKLSNEIEQASWKLLEDHQKRDAILIVDQELDLVETGIFIAEDNLDKIKAYLKDEKLIRPTEEIVSHYQENEDFIFNFIIIQPYVLVQLQKDQ